MAPKSADSSSILLHLWALLLPLSFLCSAYSRAFYDTLETSPIDRHHHLFILHAIQGSDFVSQMFLTAFCSHHLVSHCCARHPHRPGLPALTLSVRSPSRALYYKAPSATRIGWEPCPLLLNFHLHHTSYLRFFFLLSIAYKSSPSTLPTELCNSLRLTTITNRDWPLVPPREHLDVHRFRTIGHFLESGTEVTVIYILCRPLTRFGAWYCISPISYFT